MKFVVVEGPLKGQEFKIRPGHIVGRNRGDILLKDKKVSTQHAEIVQKPEGLFLVDLVSQNGLWVGDARRAEILLEPKLQIRIGQTLLQVEADPSKESADIKRVRQQIRRTRDLPTAPLADVHPFRPPIQLIYRAGPQAGESEILGFGPRRFGSGVLDIEMMDPQVAELAFELRMGPGGLEILCQQSGVLVNGNPVSHYMLAEGDWIQVGQSILEVKTYKDTDGKEGT